MNINCPKKKKKLMATFFFCHLVTKNVYFVASHGAHIKKKLISDPVQFIFI